VKYSAAIVNIGPKLTSSRSNPSNKAADVCSADMNAGASLSFSTVQSQKIRQNLL